LLLVTNNSTTSPELVAQRLQYMNIEVTPAEILTSAQAATAYVSAHAQRGARVCIVGEAGLRQAAVEEGLTIVDDGQTSVDWVVAGLDHDFDYAKLTSATRAIMAGARFVAPTPTRCCPLKAAR